MPDIAKYMDVDVGNISKVYGISKSNIGKLVGVDMPIGGIDQYTKLLLHMDGDQSGSDHLVTSNSGTKLDATTKKFGASSTYFDGDAHLIVPNHADWEFGSGSFTIDWWEYRTDTTSGGISRDATTVWCPWLLGYYVSGPKIYMSGDGASWDIADGKTLGTASLNEWVHMAVVRDGTTFYAFKNGTQTDTWESATAFPANSNSLAIGRAQSIHYYSGYIDELRIVKGEAIWTSNFSVPTAPHATTANTKLLLHMNGDESDSNHIVTLNGDPQISRAQEKWNGSYYFDGSGAYLSIPDSDDWNFGSGEFTIDFWINWDAAVNGGIFAQSEGPLIYDRSFLFQYWTGDIWFITGDGSAAKIIQFAFTPTVDQWYHFAFIREVDALKCYIDGVWKQTVDMTVFTLEDSGNDFDIGRGHFTDTSFAGYIDEFRVSKDIARWTSNFSVPTGPYTT